MSESPEVLKWAGRPDARRAKGGGADRVQDVVVQSMEVLGTAWSCLVLPQLLVVLDVV